MKGMDSADPLELRSSKRQLRASPTHMRRKIEQPTPEACTGGKAKLGQQRQRGLVQPNLDVKLEWEQAANRFAVPRMR